MLNEPMKEERKDPNQLIAEFLKEHDIVIMVDLVPDTKKFDDGSLVTRTCGRMNAVYKQRR